MQKKDDRVEVQKSTNKQRRNQGAQIFTLIAKGFVYLASHEQMNKTWMNLNWPIK